MASTGEVLDLRSEIIGALLMMLTRGETDVGGGKYANNDLAFLAKALMGVGRAGSSRLSGFSAAE